MQTGEASQPEPANQGCMVWDLVMLLPQGVNRLKRWYLNNKDIKPTVPYSVASSGNILHPFHDPRSVIPKR